MEIAPNRIVTTVKLLLPLALTVGFITWPCPRPQATTRPTPHTGQSRNVAIIGSPTVSSGGFLPTTGPAGELGDFVFTNLAPLAVNATNLAAFDTVVLNVASPQMSCNTGTLSASAKAALVAFVGSGKKMIIYDSECSVQDCSWLPFPFTTSNPGPRGATGTLTIVENNFLASNDPADPHYINAACLGSSTDAVGDMNVMTTRDPNWCISMSGTNVRGDTGPVHTYAPYPTRSGPGLFIYNGLDLDDISSGCNPNGLRKIWVQELQQPFNPPVNLACVVTPVGITLNPPSATNPVGTSHTVTARLTDQLGNPLPGRSVTFQVVSGPNAGAGGTCNPASCMSDANGEVRFTYISGGATGTDTIQACFTNNAGQQQCSQQVTKTWAPAGPTDVSSQVTISRRGYRLNYATGRYYQVVLLQNTSTSAIASPISLMLDGLSSNATLFNSIGSTACVAPLNSSYIDVPAGSDNVLSPGETATVMLQFTDPTNQGITYNTRVLAGAGCR